MDGRCSCGSDPRCKTTEMYAWHCHAELLADRSKLPVASRHGRHDCRRLVGWSRNHTLEHIDSKDSVSSSTIFCCIEISNRPYQASLFGILEPDQDDTPGLKPSISGLSWSSASSSDSLKRQKLYHHRPTDLESLTSDRAIWIQRRNSLSSQSAIYQRTLRYSSTGPLSSPASLHLNRSPSSFFPQVPHSASYRCTSTSSTTTPTPSALGTFYSSLPSTRAGPTISSVSRSTSSTSTRKSPLSTMRRASEPEVPLIPAKFLDAKSKPQLQRIPTLPYSWSPSLTHAPLSADPAIRAFSTKKETFERPVTGGVSTRRMASNNGIRFVEPSLYLISSSRSSSITPELPVRARGHSIPSDIVPAVSPSTNVSAPTATYSTRPRISATPTSSALSSLYVPRARPVLASNQGSGNSTKRPQLMHQTSSACSNRATSSTLTTDFATHNILEAQRVERRWELARSREAGAYGMGGWSLIPEDGDAPITSMRKAVGRDREKKRACAAS
jgi:hypothetical protein